MVLEEIKKIPYGEVIIYNDIAKVYGQTHDDIKVVGPSSGRFNPLDYISESALNKLTLFCND